MYRFVGNPEGRFCRVVSYLTDRLLITDRLETICNSVLKSFAYLDLCDLGKYPDTTKKLLTGA